jgi:two-component system cell cycle sensor histidine kinase/response regulator CckA
MPVVPEDPRLRALARWSEATDVGLAWLDAGGAVAWSNGRWAALGGVTEGPWPEGHACLAQARARGAATLEREVGGRRVRLTIEALADGEAMATAIDVGDEPAPRAADGRDEASLRERLHDSEERFRSAFESAGIGMALVARDGRFLAVNHGFCELTRYTEAELLARDFQGMTHPDDLAADLELLRQLLRGARRSYQMEKRYICGDGSVVWAKLTVSLVRDAAGRPIYFISQVEDITARRQAEAALSASEARYRALVEAADDPIAALDRDGRFLIINAVAAALVGRTPADLIGCNFADLVPPERAARWITDVRAALREGRTQRSEREVATAHGPRTFQTKLIPVRDAAGAWTMVIALGRDLTEQQRLAAERRALSERAEKAQRLESLSVMAGGVAHDLNNLLAVVLGYADCARLDAEPGSDLADALEQIADAARRAGELTSQLNAVTGKATRRLDVVGLPALARETVALLRPSIPPGCQVRAELAPATVEGDPTQLRQIALNLLLNAAQAVAPGGGTITVRTGLRELAADARDPSGLFDMPSGPCAFLSVQDDGCGMTPEVQRRVFEPFFSTKADGRGLGLAVVLGVARGHGGGVRFSSEPGRGTLVEVLLPAAAPEPAEAPRTPAPQATLQGRGVVLIVDDERAVRDSLQHALVLLGFEVRAFGGGPAALAALRDDPAAVVLAVLDLRMPGMDGLEVLRELRRIRPDLPVVISSGHAGPLALDDVEDVERLRFLPKPYGLAELQAVLQAALRGRDAS